MPKQFYLYPRKLKGKTIYYCQFSLPDGTRTHGRSTGCTAERKAATGAIEQIKKAERESVLQKIDEQKSQGIFTGIDGSRVALIDFAGLDFFAWESRGAISRRTGDKAGREMLIYI